MSLLRTRELEAGLALVEDALTRARGIYLSGNGGGSARVSHLAVEESGKGLGLENEEVAPALSITPRSIEHLPKPFVEKGWDA